MADAELKVRIDAEIGNFSSKLKKGEQDLSNFSGKVSADLKKTAASAASVSAQLGGSVAKGSNQAAFALTNLGRVAQDAPFGFIGIQNNLNPLLESFQRLKKETGSAGSALKALGGSLLGAGGLGLALSVVSAGILLYQQYQQKANKTVKEAKTSADEYANSLGQVQRAQLVGAQSAAQETTTLNLLFKQYQNGALSLDKRKSAYNEIQRLYPAYFGNIKFEQEASIKTKDAYDKLTTSILATARARAAGDLITKNSQRQLENEQKIIDLTTAGDKAKITTAKALQAAKVAGGELGQAKADLALTDSLRNQSEIQKQINNLKTDSNILRDKNLQLEKSVNTELEKGAVLSGSLGGDRLKKVDEAKFAREKKIGIERLNSLDTFLAKYRATEALINKTPLIGLPPDITTRLTEPLTTFSDYVKGDILPNLGSSFKTFFDDILMNGKFSFASLGKSIISTFASVLASEATTGILGLLGDKGAQKKGNLFSTVGKALGIGGKGLGALGGILGGVGIAVAGASLLGGLFKKKQPTPQPAYSTSTATTSSASSVDFGGGRVVFEISGVNLVGVLNRAGAKLQRFGP